MLKAVEIAISLIAAVLLFLLMMMTFVDVIGRNFFNRPLNGAAEMTELILAAVVFLMLPFIAIRQKHIVVDLLDIIHNRVFKAIQTLLMIAVGTFFFGMMALRLWHLADSTARYNDATPTMQIPIAPLVYGMSILSAITAACFLALLLNFFRDTRGTPGDADASDGKSMVTENSNV
ncbi:TRAP transporter small permease [Oceanicola sp. 22II-s10i]|uniref:TRAP transporter small permease n=1 Tax=Oceanicola sp. 22II-s10i TaxID=1317116 RepID=UPI000B528546|nr:TRAP transporter small permease [Oceanicola sp. 22II-s10i]